MNSSRMSANSGKIVSGLIIVTVGVIFLLRQMGYIFPYWLFTWPMILIVIGLINGAKHGFRNFGWLILVGLGAAFLIDQIYPVYHITRYTWPLLIIAAGLFMIFGRPRANDTRRGGRARFTGRWSPTAPLDLPATDATTALPNQPGQPLSTTEAPAATTAATAEFIDINAVLGGVKRTIFSKNVTGADINAFMGGAEINLSQADIQGRVVMDINLVMGGCKLIVPSHWEIIAEVTTILGGIEDKRLLAPTAQHKPPKMLVIKGLALMGGIEIQSYV